MLLESRQNTTHRTADGMNTYAHQQRRDLVNFPQAEIEIGLLLLSARHVNVTVRPVKSISILSFKLKCEVNRVRWRDDTFLFPTVTQTRQEKPIMVIDRSKRDGVDTILPVRALNFKSREKQTQECRASSYNFLRVLPSFQNENQ